MAKQSPRAPVRADWQPPAGKHADRFQLDEIDPAAMPWSCGDKSVDRQRVDELALELDELQNLFYADRRFGLLIVLQGMDAAGKDGTIRSVFARTSPLGVHSVAWKVPNEEEREHDFLWRIHRQAPRAGEIVVFNRSHYEDVLVPVANRAIKPAALQQRYQHINEFERMLCENGTVLLKFMLHISRGEQRQRLQARVDDPTKRWKFAAGDLEVRKKWTAYQAAYQALLRATSTPWAPWTVVPADSKTHRNLMVASIIRDTLRSLKLRYPPDPPGLAGLKIT
ncbi:MAG: polyphosphate--nucleotide phosphotransferase [Burkholderiales bacterium]|nr:polyphosphate--nucleotide phosphotransferase [Burkholderiales bacterium]